MLETSLPSDLSCVRKHYHRSPRPKEIATMKPGRQGRLENDMRRPRQQHRVGQRNWPSQAIMCARLPREICSVGQLGMEVPDGKTSPMGRGYVAAAMRGPFLTMRVVDTRPVWHNLPTPVAYYAHANTNQQMQQASWAVRLRLHLTKAATE